MTTHGGLKSLHVGHENRIRHSLLPLDSLHHFFAICKLQNGFILLEEVFLITQITKFNQSLLS